MDRNETNAPTEHLEKFTPDLLETGTPQHGAPQTLGRRLFCQLHVFTGCLDTAPVVEAVRSSRLDAAVYANVNDPRGAGVLVMSEEPSVFTGAARDLLTRPPFASLSPMPEFTMIGRTYALGREKDLADWLLSHPRRNALNPANQWAVWYPLRRIGAF